MNQILEKNLEKCNVFRYLSTWFAFDVCSTAPFQPLSLLFNYNGSELGFRILSMLRLWRLRRVSSLFARFIFQCLKTIFFLGFDQEGVFLNFSNSSTSLQAWERYTFQLLLDTMHKTHFRKSNIFFFQRLRSFGFKSRTHKSYWISCYFRGQKNSSNKT